MILSSGHSPLEKNVRMTPVSSALPTHICDSSICPLCALYTTSLHPSPPSHVPSSSSSLLLSPDLSSPPVVPYLHCILLLRSSTLLLPLLISSFLSSATPRFSPSTFFSSSIDHLLFRCPHPSFQTCSLLSTLSPPIPIFFSHPLLSLFFFNFPF